MKIKHFRRMNSFHNTVRVGCAAGVGLMMAHVQAGVSEPAPIIEEEAVEMPPNWVDVTVGGAFVDGDKAAYQRRVQQDGDFYGGISDMHMESVMDDLTWTLDGHAMFGNEDYEFILGLVKDDLGYIQAGYREFRTWYDGSGGYLPTVTPSWYPAADDELYLDRGEVWLEAGLRLEDLPEVTFRYTHSWREGNKDSTSWSREGAFCFGPSLWDIDEQRDLFELHVAHTLSNTDLGLGLRYEMIDNSNEKIFDDGAEVHTDSYEADIFNAHASSVTRFNDQMMLSFGYAFTTLDSDTFVSRGTSILGFNNGGASQKMHVCNANFWWNPIEDLVLIPSFRAEWNDADAISNFWYDGYGGDGWARPIVDVDGNTLTEEIEARYQGIDNVLLYAKVQLEQEDEETNWLYFQDNSIAASPFDPNYIPVFGLSGSRYKDCDATRNKGVIGATWYAMKGLSFAAEYYHKETDLDYDTVPVGTGLTHFGDAHIGSLDMSTDDFNIRMTWRPRADLTLVTRYDWQKTTYDMVGYDGAKTIDGRLIPLPEVESGEYEMNIISQSATYLVSQNLYLQGFVSYIWSETESAGSRGGPAYVDRSDNDYLTVSLTAGYALDEKTDITAGYSYYYAENFSVPSSSVGYGTDLEEHVFSVGLNRRINRNMIWNLGYGYYTSNDGTSGGNNDFDAHMISTGLQVRF